MIGSAFDNTGTSCTGGGPATVSWDGDDVWYEVVDFEIMDEPDEPIVFEHVFNPAILVPLRSQIGRQTLKRVSGCPPMNRGRHFDRKLKG